MPAPLSEMAISTVSPMQAVVSVRLPPWDTASIPFFTRFSTAWRSRVRSISIGGTVGSVATLTAMPWRAASGRTNSATALTMSLTESSSNCGRGKRAKARYSSVSASRAPTWSRIAVTSAVRTSCATFRDSRPTVAIRSASTSSSCAARRRVSVPVSSALSRSTSERARRSRSATWPTAKAGSPTKAIRITTAVHAAAGGARLAAAQ